MSRNPKACDLDVLLELCVDKWRGLTECWAQHYQALFELHCSSFSVVSEMTFALDGGDPCSGLAVAIEDKDAVCMNEYFHVHLSASIHALISEGSHIAY